MFPGSGTLRYIIPFHPPEETLEYVSKLRGSSCAAIFADDGEKFGIWPYTYRSVYEEGWLERFFELIGKNLEWIEPVPLGAYAIREKPLGRIYLPCSSYMEMDEWSLPTEAMVEYGKVVERLKGGPEGEKARRFIKGGFWRNFFAKYPLIFGVFPLKLFRSRRVDSRRFFKVRVCSFTGHWIWSLTKNFGLTLN